MKIAFCTAALALALTVTPGWAGEDLPAGDKVHISSSQEAEIAAVVEAIDHTNRLVTLVGPDGDSITFTAGEEVRNLAQVEVGDTIYVEYVQTVTVEVRDGAEGDQASASEVLVAGRTEKGEKPGMAAIDSRVATAVVEAINLEANTFKLKSEDGSVDEFTAENPENLKKAAVGDLVVITFTEAFAVSIERPTADQE